MRELVPETFYKSFKGIAEEIKKCTKCPLHRARTSAVPGEGGYGRRIFLLGEAPGREEDLTGRPFVGRAGRLLDGVMAEAQFSREDVFITSVVKCRPRENRSPGKREIKVCLPYTHRQIETLQPSVIVLMGNVAMEALAGRRGISKLRGREIRRWGRLYLPTYHPAAVLRNMNLRPLLLKDLEKALRLAQ